MRVRTILVAALIALCVAIPSTASAKVRFAGHVTLTRTSCCGFQGVVFRVFGNSHVPYRVCLIRPSGSKRCRNLRTGPSSRPSRTFFVNPNGGTYRVIWKVHGRIVDTAHYFVAAEGV